MREQLPAPSDATTGHPPPGTTSVGQPVDDAPSSESPTRAAGGQAQAPLRADGASTTTRAQLRTNEAPATAQTPAPLPADEAPAAAAEPGLVELLGGRRGALDASLPAVGFGVGWLAGGQALEWAIAGAVAVGLAVAGWRLWRRHQPRAAVLGLTGVLLGALIAARTGRPEDFFLLQLLSNVVSALLWSVSIWLRRPLLGMIVGAVLRQGKSWRLDPELRRAYAAASWWWTGTYLLRTVVFGVLWASGAVVALTVARVALSWPLVASCIALSWRTIRLRLKRAGHPGIRHPRVPRHAEPESAR